MQYTVDHSTAAYLVGPEGELAQVLPYGMPAAEIAQAIHRALNP
jgi:cytochrome oxidase Cu insertion factor (SCO1/SenC/PrrC family)